MKNRQPKADSANKESHLTGALSILASLIARDILKKRVNSLKNTPGLDTATPSIKDQEP